MKPYKKTEKASRVSCPNGHGDQPMLHFLRLVGHPEQYCIICGAKLIDETYDIDIYYCSKCDKPVNTIWPYCPYCGEKLSE